jgi:hypothetical protein
VQRREEEDSAEEEGSKRRRVQVVPVRMWRLGREATGGGR